MAVTIGGMRHIGTTAGLVDQVCGELRKLDEQSLREVLNYIARITQTKNLMPSEEVGSVEAVRKHVGKWSFNEGERDKLVQELYELRERVG